MITLKTEAIGLKKPIDVQVTIKRRRDANAMMIEMLKADLQKGDQTPLGKLPDDAPEEDIVKALIETREQADVMLDDAFKYVSETLGLTKRQQETVEKTVDDLTMIQYAQYVIDRINGKSEEQFAAEQAAVEDVDPKKAEQ